jgi:adenylylsulfate kinase-like enzyme
MLRERGKKVEILDGDEVRENLSKGLGFSKEDRDTNIRRIGFVANLLARNGVVAITAAISPYRPIRDECRKKAQAPVRRGLRRSAARHRRGARHEGPLQEGPRRD